MENLEKKSRIKSTTEIIDGAGIVPTGEIMATREEIEKMALKNLMIIPFADYTIVMGLNNKKIMPEGNYLTTPEHVKQMVLNRIKYAN